MRIDESEHFVVERQRCISAAVFFGESTSNTTCGQTPSSNHCMSGYSTSDRFAFATEGNRIGIGCHATERTEGGERYAAAFVRLRSSARISAAAFGMFDPGP